MILAENSDDPGGGTNFEAGLTNMQFIFSIHAGSRHRNCIVIGIVGAALQHAQIQILLIESTGLFSGVIILSRQEIFIGSEIGIDQIFLIPLGHHGDIAFITLLQGTILNHTVLLEEGFGDAEAANEYVHGIEACVVKRHGRVATLLLFESNQHRAPVIIGHGQIQTKLIRPVFTNYFTHERRLSAVYADIPEFGNASVICHGFTSDVIVKMQFSTAI